MSAAPPSPFHPSSRWPARGAGDGGPPTVAERLIHLVEALDTAYHRLGRGVIVRVSGLAADAPEVELVPIDPHQAYDEFLGAEASPRWDAVGVLVPGTARSMGDDGHRRGERLGRAVVAFVVARDGTSASSLRIGDGRPVVQVGGVDDCVGRLVDVVRRGFGLPTAAPVAAVGSVVWRVWLHRIHTRAVAAEAVTVELVDDLRPTLPATWHELRAQCTEGRWPELGVHPELAAWMDDGIFSRACTEAFPESLEVVTELGELLAPPVWRHVVGRLGTAAGPSGQGPGPATSN